ncbi:transcription factor 15-like [Schistocerca nitens]|uniref:transcription factor 15-like n=1 Tax=Schistocerca nitens TaxID=7011 RepID=UPI002118C02F|nr:transcription factor 15-like [Schistocerca nitens]
MATNAPERCRTHNVNSAYTALRSLIPTEPRDRKLSRIETLRLAVSYITHLSHLITASNDSLPCHQLSLENERETYSTICTFCLTHVHGMGHYKNKESKCGK